MATSDRLQSDRPLTLRVERREGVAIVTLEGACTMDVSHQIRHCLVGLATEQVPLIVLDMAQLDFIDSVGLGGIIAAHLRGRHHDGHVRLVAPNEHIREVLDLTRLSRLFQIFPTVSEAVSTPPA